jgi:putative membrane protein
VRKRHSASRHFFSAGPLRLDEIVGGALSGVLATGPMTAFIWATQRKLKWYERYAMPPRQITRRILASLGATNLLREPEQSSITTLFHFGYGAAMGALYRFVTPEQECGKLSIGMAYGIAVWTANYLGLLPALGILRPATQHPVRRSMLMIGAHLLWGAILSYLTKSNGRITPAPRQDSP